MDFIPEDGAVFVKAARKCGLDLSKKKTAFLIQGEDHPGVAAGVGRKLGEAGINIVSMQTVCAGTGRFGGLFWVKPEDARRAAKILGAE